MIQNLVDYRAKAFLHERNGSSIAYEVKGVRAIWDPSLSIPGTNRRGGWRCPLGTRYGGQITDRFGRQCGWGAARRIANMISDVGQRLEQIDDSKRGRRIARRERRILERLAPSGNVGRVERGLRGIADRLDGVDNKPNAVGGRTRRTIARVNTPNVPSIDTAPIQRELTPAPRPPRAPRRRPPQVGRPEGNLRDSEARRMEREIVNPGAPRTGEAPARPRRQRAVVETAKTPKPPKAEPSVQAQAEPVVEPKVVKPRRPKKNPEGDIGAMLDAESEQRRVPKPARRGNSDNAARSEELRQNRQAMELAVLADAKKRERARGAGQKVDLNQALGDGNFQEYLVRDIIPNDRIMIINDASNFPNSPVRKRSKRDEARQKIAVSNARLQLLQQEIESGKLSDNDFIERNGERVNIARVKTYLKDYRDSWQEVLDGNLSAEAPKATSAKPKPINDLPKTPNVEAPKPIKVGNESPSELAFKPAKIDVANLSPANEKIVEDALLQIKDPKNLQNFGRHVDEMIFNDNQGRMAAEREFQNLLQGIVEKYKADPQIDLKKTIEEAQLSYIRRIALNRLKLSEALNRDKAAVDNAWALVKNPTANLTPAKMEELRVSKARDIAKIKENIGRYEQMLANYDRFGTEVDKAVKRIQRGLNFNPDATGVVKPLDEDVVKKIKSQIDDAIKRRSGKLAKYMDKRYGLGKKPFEDMTPEKWRSLDTTGKKKYLEEAYGHSRIEGANGRLYNAVATVRMGNNDQHSVSVIFNEIDANGNIIRAGIGDSGRLVSVNGGYVKQSTMFVRSKMDRGADIQTIYNQHAFLFLKQIGISQAKVGAVDDGQYVWARVGFNGGNISENQLGGFKKALSFYENFGQGGLINSEAEYFRIKSMIAQTRAGKKFIHQDWIFAIDDPANDKVRREFVKHWFKSNLPFSSGTFSFAKNKIGGTAPRRQRARAVPRGNA